MYDTRMMIYIYMYPWYEHTVLPMLHMYEFMLIAEIVGGCHISAEFVKVMPQSFDVYDKLKLEFLNFPSVVRLANHSNTGPPEISYCVRLIVITSPGYISCTENKNKRFSIKFSFH